MPISIKYIEPAVQEGVSVLTDSTCIIIALNHHAKYLVLYLLSSNNNKNIFCKAKISIVQHYFKNQ